MKRLLILPIVAMTAIPAHADNMITRFWDKSTPYAEIDIVKPLSSDFFDKDKHASASGFEASIGIEYNKWLEIGLHHSKIIMNGDGMTTEQDMVKSKFKLDWDYKLIPFAGIGIGISSLNQTAFAYELSVGFDGKLTDKVVIRTQVFRLSQQLAEKFDGKTHAEDVGIKVGIKFNF